MAWVQRMTGRSPIEPKKMAEISVKTFADPFVFEEQDFVSFLDADIVTYSIPCAVCFVDGERKSLIYFSLMIRYYTN